MSRTAASVKDIQHWLLCVFTLQQTCGFLCLFLQGHLPQLPVKAFSRSGCLDKDKLKDSYQPVKDRGEDTNLLWSGWQEIIRKEILGAKKQDKGGDV